VVPGPTDRMVIDVDAQVPEVAPHKKPKRLLSFATKNEIANFRVSCGLCGASFHTGCIKSNSAGKCFVVHSFPASGTQVQPYNVTTAHVDVLLVTCNSRGVGGA